MKKSILLTLFLVLQTSNPALGKMSSKALQLSVDKLRQQHQLKANRVTKAQSAVMEQLHRDLKKKHPDLLPKLARAMQKHKKAKAIAKDAEVRKLSDVLVGEVPLYDSRLVLEASERVRITMDKEACEGLEASFTDLDKPMQKLKICEPQGPLDPSRLTDPRPGSGITTPPYTPPQPRTEQTVLDPDYADSFAVPNSEANVDGFMRVEGSQTTAWPSLGGFAQIANFFRELVGGTVNVKATVEVLGGEQSAWVALGSVSAETIISLVVAKGDTTKCFDNQQVSSLQASAGLEVVSVEEENIESSTFELSCEFDSDGVDTEYEIQNNFAAFTSVDTLTGSVSTTASIKLREIEITMQE